MSIIPSAVVFRAFFATVLLGAASSVNGADKFASESLEGLDWRLIGPYRGGRVTTVTGVPGNPLLYYMGATGGGVWKTENAGVTWENLSDGFFKVGTIGAVAVAESDPNVIYVGTGESPIRGVTTSHGDGVWKSTDAGRTWKHIGLEASGQISRIKINPQNSAIAYIAVQGQIWGPNEERGIFRTGDGGASWEHVLQVGPSTGASDLAMDPTNPRILYAAMWNHGRKPWFIHSGGTDGGIYKSIDGGDSWEKLGGGLPEMIGKIGVDVSASNPDRLYAIVEAEHEKGGLYRSEDAGKTWVLINGHRVLHSRARYYIHITADPVDEDTVYVMNVPMMKSVDGGKSWEKMKLPHGDHHDHWINPKDSRNMINANDGGATITFDGGETWSSIMNQPTAQFYRVVTDNLIPYRIYAGQQDNSTVAIASRTFDSGIGVEDFYPVGGGESAHIAFDPDDPSLVYATTINGTLTEYNHKTRLTRSIIPYPEMVYGKDSKDLKYRANWNAPVAVSPHDPSIIYFGTQVLLRSTDRGMTWSEISPDLTRNDLSKQGRNGGPLTPENVGAEFYNTIFYIVESPAQAGTIWAGSDDGLVYLTRDNGEHWEDVSPPHQSEAMINAIELSPHDPGTAYLAVTGYKLNDLRPYIYVSHDYGRRWRRIDKGLPMDAFVRVVREDSQVPGLLYAGTEAGMFVSPNGGKDWQSLQLNLPPVPITDLALRHDNLVAATQGRALWVLDDLFLVREAASSGLDATLHVFTPSATQMIPKGRKVGQFEGENPAAGVPLYYSIGEGVSGDLSIEILDQAGQLVRLYSGEESAHDRCRIGNMDPRLPFTIKYPPAETGLNRWVWDMKQENIRCIADVDIFAGFSGPRVIPGTYRARISIGEIERWVTFNIVSDPRVKASEHAIEAWSETLTDVSALMNVVLEQLEGARRARREVQSLLADHAEDAALSALAVSAIDRISDWDKLINQELHQTYEDEDAWETKLAGQLRYLLDVIDNTGAPVTDGALSRFADLKAEWGRRGEELEAISREYIAPINAWAKSNQVKHITVPQ